MKLLTIFLIGLLLSSCAHKLEPRAQFNEKEPIQIIKLSKKLALPVQNDIILEQSDLEKKLSAISPNFNSRVKKAQRSQTWANVAFVTQLLTLGICAAQTETDNVMAWCAASLATGIFATRPLVNRTNETKLKLLEDFNSSLK